MTVNKYKNIIIDKYAEYDENNRLVKDRAHNLEYLTTMRYIQKFLKPGASILEIGAGTGRYSLALAKIGYDVTAVDLVPQHVEVMKRKGRRLKNFHCQVADALDLSMFKDASFDLVLNLGPMYHLFSPKDKKTCIRETLRVAKKGSICMFAYITHAALIMDYGLRYKKVAEVLSFMDKDGKVRDIPENVFNTFHSEDFNKLFDKTPTQYITTVATDGVGIILRELIEQLSKKDYQALIEWHFRTCERPDQRGLSNHLLYICKKK